MTIAIRDLSGVPFDTIYETFVLGFSDYVVPLQPDRKAFEEMQTRRGFDPAYSAGAFDGDQLVGIVLTCIDGARAYNSGTTVITSHRRHKLGRAMMDQAISLIGGREYILEVLVDNPNAIALYESIGFQRARRFQVWTYESKSQARITEIANADLEQIRSWCDVEPSWQNDVPSLRRARDPYVVLGTLQGAAVLFPNNGDVPLLAVSPEARRQGLGRRLLEAAATRANKPLRILNVDDSDAGIAAFLEKCGATRKVAQWEMVRSVTQHSALVTQH